MCTDKQTAARQIQIELVDNWHPRWREVLDAIEHLGMAQSLNIDSDGWLSARHNLLVALIDDQVAGHLCFRVQTISGPDGQVCHEHDSGRPSVEATVESLGVQPGFSQAEVESLLTNAAQGRARALRCRELILSR
jgi:hypothetical protein